MSGLEIAVLVVVSAWLAILTLVVVLLVRQIGLITVRLSIAGENFSLDDDGPEVGSRIPDEVVSLLPELDEGRVHLLLLSASCDPCRQLAVELSDYQLDSPVVALIPGRGEIAEEIADLLPSGIKPVFDPEAVELAGLLGIESTPFAIRVEDGNLSKKAYLYNGAPDFISFLEEEKSEPGLNGSVQITKKEVIDNDR